MESVLSPDGALAARERFRVSSRRYRALELPGSRSPAERQQFAASAAEQMPPAMSRRATS
jgi:hypothetical protein